MLAQPGSIPLLLSGHERARRAAPRGTMEPYHARRSTESPVTAIGYIRVSSRAQDNATLRPAIERAAAARGDEIGTWYAEKRSAKKMARFRDALTPTSPESPVRREHASALA